MKGILRLEDGREITVNEDQIQNILKETGYNKNVGICRATINNPYFFCDSTSEIQTSTEKQTTINDSHWITGNYYTNKLLLIADAKADILKRKIKRDIRMYNKYNKRQYNIIYTFEDGLGIIVNDTTFKRDMIYYNFNMDKETAIKIIHNYKDDLLWYFEDYYINYAGTYGKEITLNEDCK